MLGLGLVLRTKIGGLDLGLGLDTLALALALNGKAKAEKKLLCLSTKWIY